MSRESLKAFIDRIEGDVAVLQVGEEGRQVNIPVRYLPDNVEEGTVVVVHFEVDLEATKKAKQTTAGLIERLRRKNS